MHSLQPTILAFQLRNLMAQKRLRQWAHWMVAMSFRRTSLSGPTCAWTPHISIRRTFPSTMRAAGERPEFDIKPPLGAPLLVFPRGYILKTLPHGDTSARQQGFGIRDFPFQGELPKAIECHLPVCQLYRWQLKPKSGLRL